MPEIRQYIATLESQNLKLQRQVGKLEAINITANNRIKALEQTINNSLPKAPINNSLPKAPIAPIDFRRPSHEETEVLRLTKPAT